MIAYLTVYYGDFTFSDVQVLIESLFEQQYTLTVTINDEGGYLTDPDTGEEYYAPTIAEYTFVYNDLDTILREQLSSDSDKLELYEEILEIEIEDGEAYTGEYGDVSDAASVLDDLTDVEFPLVETPGAKIRLSSLFGPRHITGGSPDHAGIDIPAAEETNIYAIADGVVHAVDYTSSAGYYVTLKHVTEGNTYYTVYMHMVRKSTYVYVGETVTKGQHIGDVGATGDAQGNHLHFEIREGTNSRSYAINPFFLFTDLSFIKDNTTYSGDSLLAYANRYPNMTAVQNAIASGNY